MTPIEEFVRERDERIKSNGDDPAFNALANNWISESMRRQYVYNFQALGRPIIQFPQDMVAVQELIWSVKPDLIIETGIAHGGSLIQSAMMLALLDVCDAARKNEAMPAKSSSRKVVGIDIDIRDHNRKAIEEHPLNSYIQTIEGSSIAEDVVEQVRKIAKDHKTIMVFLDSMHTHDHVLAGT